MEATPATEGEFRCLCYYFISFITDHDEEGVEITADSFSYSDEEEETEEDIASRTRPKRKYCYYIPFYILTSHRAPCWRLEIPRSQEQVASGQEVPSRLEPSACVGVATGHGSE